MTNEATPLYFPDEATPETCGLPPRAIYRAINPSGGFCPSMDCYRATVLALVRRGWKLYPVA